jgi:hypothetical protein
MDQEERHCQICAVPFNIGRARTKFEPSDAARWSELQSYPDHDTPRCLAFWWESECEEDEEGGHIAGPGCAFDRAYSGHRIMVAEMTVSFASLKSTLALCSTWILILGCVRV